MSVGSRGLLGRLDALTALVDQRRGLQLAPDGALTRAEAVAVAAGLPGPHATAEAALLLTLGLAVGVLRASGLRIQVSALYSAWARLDDGLRAGLIYAAWVHRVHWPRLLGEEACTAPLQRERTWMLRLLYGLPPLVEVSVPGLARVTAERTGLTGLRQTTRFLTAGYLDPLAALGVADLDPPAPGLPRRLRLDLAAQVVIASALVACGEEVPLTSGPCMS